MSDAKNGDADADADADADDAPDESGKPASRTPPGCIVKPTIVAAVCLTAGIYLVNSPTVGGVGRFAAVVLIFFGGILSIPFMMIVVGMSINWYFQRKLTGALKDALDPAR